MSTWRSERPTVAEVDSGIRDWWWRCSQAPRTAHTVRCTTNYGRVYYIDIDGDDTGIADLPDCDQWAPCERPTEPMDGQAMPDGAQETTNE